MRAILDANVLIAALLSPRGSPARLLRAWLDGAFELIVSAELLAELERALAYPKIRRRVSAEAATAFIDVLRRGATQVDDPPAGSQLPHSPDPGDDYLLALASAHNAILVSGDHHLLEMRAGLPIYAPAEFLRLVPSDPAS